MEKEYPSNCCYECGISANVLTCIKKYGKPPKKLCFDTSTYNWGECGNCKEVKHVTQPRDFFYPDFTLLSRNFNIRYDHIQN